jgi:protein ImuA
MTDNRSPSRNSARSRTLRELACQLKQMEATRRPGGHEEAAATGIPALDSLLPDGGFRGGTLIEWLADSAASGVDLLAILAARSLLREGRVLVVLDREKKFYPPAAAAWGIAPQQTIVVRPQNTTDVLWALEQCLQSSGVAVSLCRLERVTSRVLRRLQLAAERGGGRGFLLRALSARDQPAWSDVRLVVNALLSPSLRSPPGGRRWRVELVRCRRGAGEKTVILELDDATGLVSEASELALPARGSRPARA